MPERSSKGRFITVEGIEGVGKSTHVRFLEQLVSRHGQRPCLTREPGGTAAGEEIRGLLLQRGGDAMDPLTELLLIFAARAQHVAEVIRPALDRGEVVICDRFIDATYAYQGGGRGIDRARIATLEALVLDGLRPDLTILLDAAVGTGLERVESRGESNRFDDETVQFFERVRACYLEIARGEPRRVRVVNAEAELEQVRTELSRIVEEFLAC